MKMNTTKLVLVLLTLLISNVLWSQNFEGVIVYERMTDNGKAAIETYYFGKNKLRIDTEYYLDNTIKEYSRIYLFDRYDNHYFDKVNGTYVKKEKSTSDGIIGYEESLDSVYIMDRKCRKVDVQFPPNQFTSQWTQERWLSEDLYFEIPEGWLFDYSMVCHRDKRIVLKYRETMYSEISITLPPTSWMKRAIGIYPYEFNDSVFDVSYKTSK